MTTLIKQAFKAIADIEYIVNGAEDTPISDEIINVIKEFRRPKPELKLEHKPETRPVVIADAVDTAKIESLIKQGYVLFSAALDGGEATFSLLFIRKDVQIPQRSVGVLDCVDVTINND